MGGTDDHPLPAWPMRAACAAMTTDATWLRGHDAAAARRSVRGGRRAARRAAALRQARPLLRAVAAVAAGGSPGSSLRASLAGDEGEPLLAALREAAAVLYNATGGEACFDLALEGPAAGNAGAAAQGLGGVGGRWHGAAAALLEWKC
jgi:hypothetical protein